MMFIESLGWGALRIQRLNRRIVMSSPRKTQFGKFLLVLFALASILVTVAFSYLVFHERLTRRSGWGLALIVAGTLAMLIP